MLTFCLNCNVKIQNMVSDATNGTDVFSACDNVIFSEWYDPDAKLCRRCLHPSMSYDTFLNRCVPRTSTAQESTMFDTLEGMSESDKTPCYPGEEGCLPNGCRSHDYEIVGGKCMKKCGRNFGHYRDPSDRKMCRLDIGPNNFEYTDPIECPYRHGERDGKCYPCNNNETYDIIRKKCVPRTLEIDNGVQNLNAETALSLSYMDVQASEQKVTRHKKTERWNFFSWGFTFKWYWGLICLFVVLIFIAIMVWWKRRGRNNF